MAKPKRKKRKPGSGRPSPQLDLESILQELESLKPELEKETAGPIWGQVQRLLVKAKADPSAAAHVVISRDLGVLDQLISELRNPELALANKEAESEAEETEDVAEVPTETLREAMKAFRKRLKLTKLDHESKLGRNPLTTGKPASFESIIPPHQYPPEVWKALVARGELEATGQGFYKLPTTSRPEF